MTLCTLFVALATAVVAVSGAASHYEATFCPNGCTVTDNQFTCTRKGGITVDTNALTAGTGELGNSSFVSFIVVALDQAKPRDFTALFFNSSALTPPPCNLSTEVGRSKTFQVGTCTNLKVKLNETYMFSLYVVSPNKNQSASGRSSNSESWCSGGKHDSGDGDDDLSAWEVGLIIAAAVVASLVVLLGVGGIAFFLIRRRRASYEVINSSFH
jgi:hypothetical protein